LARSNLVPALTVLGVVWGSLAAGGEGSAPPAPLPLPDVARTSESRFVHRIALLDAKGTPIGPTSEAPYSPRMTCQGSGPAPCHSYETISKGTHSRAYPSLRPEVQRPDRFMWTLFDGSTGMAAPVSHGALAAKPAAFDPKVHMTSYKLAMRFGPFHVGGGRLELDAAGNRYDAHLAANPALRTASGSGEGSPAADPDYYQAQWDQSGVLEADCLACHALRGYDHVERATQIAAKNLQWAATVGAGFGVVEGKVSDLPIPSGGEKPEVPVKVKYNPAIFSPEGTVHLELGKPPDANCLFCHRRPARGQTAWTDCLDADVHSKAGLRCVDCHRGGADHVLAGNRKTPKPEFASLTCRGCHTTGRIGAPVPAHQGLPRLHLDKIACETCHVGPRPRTIPLIIERPTDPLWSVPRISQRPSGPPCYAPVYGEDPNGLVNVFLRLLPAYYANRRPDSSLVPLDPAYVFSRFSRAAEAIKDDNGDKAPEVNTDAEIKAMLTALKKKDVKPAYVVGGRAYELDEKGELTSTATPLGDPIDLPLAHNVRPAPQALGAEGCTECHRSKAPFFQAIAPTRAAGGDGRPEGTPTYERLGKSRLDLNLASVRERYVRRYGPLALGAVAFVILLHYVLFGPKRFERTLPEELVVRFGIIERLVHLTLLGSFLCLAVTGLLIAAGVERLLGFRLTRCHDWASWSLIGGALLAVLLWARDMILSKIDLGWLKVLGGYLGYKGHVPAGRFNAGQKLFYWFILLVVACLAVTGLAIRYELGGERWETAAYTLHEACAWVMMLCVLAHAYLGTFANPGTIGAVFHGKVARPWLEHHHPDYKPKGK